MKTPLLRSSHRSQRRPPADPLDRLAAAYGVATTLHRTGRTDPCPLAPKRFVRSSVCSGWTPPTQAALDGRDPEGAVGASPARASSTTDASPFWIPMTLGTGTGTGHFHGIGADPAADHRFEAGGIRFRSRSSGRKGRCCCNCRATCRSDTTDWTFDGGDADRSAHLIVSPLGCPGRPMGGAAGAGWWQLYAIRSAGSWGWVRYEDLRQLATWSAEQGADLLLLNPLHASAPTLPQQNSPYFPASRRFCSPLYLRPQTLPEYAAASEEVRGQVDQLACLRSPCPAHRPRCLLAGETRCACSCFSRFGSPAGRGRECGARRFRALVRARRAARPRLAGLAGAVAGPGGCRRRARARAPGAGRVPPLAAALLRRAVGRRPAGLAMAAGMSTGLVSRPGRRCRPGPGRRLGAAGASSRSVRHRCAAGHVQSAGAGLGVCRRGVRTGWPKPATRRSETWCRPCCGAAAACGSTTSSGFSGCGGCRRRSAAEDVCLVPTPSDAGHPRARG